MNVNNLICDVFLFVSIVFCFLRNGNSFINPEKENKECFVWLCPGLIREILECHWRDATVYSKAYAI